LYQCSVGDFYQCIKQGGHQAKLLFKGIRTDSKGYQKRTYRSSESDCKNCPLRIQCCGAVNKFKKIDDSIDKPYYDRMHKKLTDNPNEAKRISKIRSKTAEPVLGTLINYLNMRRVNTRGIANASKHVIMSALTYNLKKLMKFKRPKFETMTQSKQIIKHAEQNCLLYIKSFFIKHIFQL
jgi:hypothetical protein